MAFIFPNIWNNPSHWLIFFLRGWNHQPDKWCMNHPQMVGYYWVANISTYSTNRRLFHCFQVVLVMMSVKSILKWRLNTSHLVALICFDDEYQSIKPFRKGSLPCCRLLAMALAWRRTWANGSSVQLEKSKSNCHGDIWILRPCWQSKDYEKGFQ